MAAQKTLRQEIEELRTELAELRAGRDEDRQLAQQQTAAAPEPSETTQVEEDEPIATGDIERAIRELAEAAESQISDNPLIVIGLTFLLGFVAGRLSRI